MTQDLLNATIEWIELKLVRLGRERRGHPSDREADFRLATLDERRTELLAASANSHPLLRMGQRGGLSDFSMSSLWLAIAAQLDRDIGELIAHAHDDGRRDYVSPWICARLFCEGRRERIAALPELFAEGKLRRRHLVSAHSRDVSPSNPLLFELRPASFLVAMATASDGFGGGLLGTARLVPPSLSLDQVALDPTHRARLLDLVRSADRVDALQTESCGPAAYDFQRSFAVLLSGAPGCGKSVTVRGLAGGEGRDLIEIDASSMAALALEDALRAMDTAFTIAAVTGSWLHFDGCASLFRTPPGEAESPMSAAFARHLQQIPAVVFVSVDSVDSLGLALRERMVAHHEMKVLGHKEAELCWQLNVPETVEIEASADFRRLAETWPLSGRAIQNAINVAARRANGAPVGQRELELAADLQQTRGLGTLARRSWLRRSLGDLLLPEKLKAQVDEIIATEGVREAVLTEWGMERRLQKGLGITCLFDGEPGTGKTLTAEVIASELGLPLFTVNVANVVSKWVGETEKNLQRIFDDAKKNRCVMLFDEADTLFSKRTNVGQAMDRYANMEIGLLLQLIEDYRGLVILTTNLKGTMDEAFMRRIAFKLSFPLPDAPTRLRIWRHLLPAEHLDPQVDLERMAQAFPLAGGNIRSIVLRSAYQARLEGSKITGSILRDVTTIECKAIGMLVRDTEGEGARKR